MDKKTLEAMRKMWLEVMHDEEGYRVTDFVEVHGDNLDTILRELIKEAS